MRLDVLNPTPVSVGRHKPVGAPLVRHGIVEQLAETGRSVRQLAREMEGYGTSEGMIRRALRGGKPAPRAFWLQAWQRCGLPAPLGAALLRLDTVIEDVGAWQQVVMGRADTVRHEAHLTAVRAGLHDEDRLLRALRDLRGHETSLATFIAALGLLAGPTPEVGRRRLVPRVLIEVLYTYATLCAHFDETQVARGAYAEVKHIIDGSGEHVPSWYGSYLVCFANAEFEGGSTGAAIQLLEAATNQVSIRRLKPAAQIGARLSLARMMVWTQVDWAYPTAIGNAHAQLILARLPDPEALSGFVAQARNGRVEQRRRATSLEVEVHRDFVAAMTGADGSAQFPVDALRASARLLPAVHRDRVVGLVCLYGAVWEAARSRVDRAATLLDTTEMLALRPTLQMLARPAARVREGLAMAADGGGRGARLEGLLPLLFLLTLFLTPVGAVVSELLPGDGVVTSAHAGFVLFDEDEED